MKLKRARRIILIIMCLLLMSTTAVLAGEQYWCTANNSYDWQNGLYCSEPGKPLYLLSYEDGWRSTTATYDYTSYNNVDIEPSTAYAYHVVKKDGLNLSDWNADVQGVIWESDRWGNMSNMKDNGVSRSSGKGKVYQRATQYGYFYYGVLNRLRGRNVFKTLTKESDLKVMIDRTTGKYTVGPYTIELDVDNANDDMTRRGAQYLYNEIVKSGNAERTDANKFATFDINSDITGVNGSNFEFVSESGQVIPFPKFVPGDVQPFYLRFKPNNAGAIIETGKPVIKISYLKGFTAGTLQKGRATQVTWGAWGGRQVDPVPSGSAGSEGTGAPAPGPGGGAANPQPTPETITIDFKTGSITCVSKQANIVSETHYHADLYISQNFTETSDGGQQHSWTETNKVCHIENIGYTATVEYVYTLNCIVNKSFHGVTVPFAETIVVKKTETIREGEQRNVSKTVNINSQGAGQNTAGAETYLFRRQYTDEYDHGAVVNKAESQKNSYTAYTTYTVVSGQWVQNKTMHNVVTIGSGGGSGKLENQNENELFLKKAGYNNNLFNYLKLANTKKITKKVDVDYSKGTIEFKDLNYTIDKTYYKATCGNKTKNIGYRAIVTAYIDVESTVNYNLDGKITQFKQRFRLKVPQKLITEGIQEARGFNANQENEYNNLAEYNDASVNLKVNQYIEGLRNTINSMNKSLIPTTYSLYSPNSWVLSETIEYETVDSTNTQDIIAKWGLFKDSNGYNITNSSVLGDIQCVERIVGNENGITEHWEDSTVEIPGSPIDIQIGGTVWLEDVNTKSDGKLGNGDRGFAGIQVKLYQESNELVATTITDSSGKYCFFGNLGDGIALINGLKKYYVTFEYDGQRYQSTYFKNDVSNKGNSGFSVAKEVKKEREAYNAKFRLISADPNNYSGGRAYSLDHKLKNGDAFIRKNNGNDPKALTYEDVYDKFLDDASKLSPTRGDCDTLWKDAKYDQVSVSHSDARRFIIDSLMSAKSELYPNKNIFALYQKYQTHIKSGEYRNGKVTMAGKTVSYLYNVNYDYGRYAGFGVESRKLTTDISLIKDVYKVSLVVNGKKEEYYYADRNVEAEDGHSSDKTDAWDSRDRKTDCLYNGEKKYTRLIRASDYLFTPSDYQEYGDDYNEKQLRAYVTYRIAVKNIGNVDVKLHELVDYYDANEYDNPVESSEQLVKDDTYKIFKNEKTTLDVVKDLSNSASYGSGGSTLKERQYNYEKIYIRGIDDKLTQGDIMYVYLTFEVKKDTRWTGTAKIRLDYKDDPYVTENPKVSIGKRNIAEINAYETFYPEGHTIPGNMGQDIKVGGDSAGIIDIDSNPGSLSNADLNDDGSIKVDTKNTGQGKDGLTVNDHQEDDTSQAPNILLIIKAIPDDCPGDDDDDDDDDDGRIRKFKGYVFEDKREETAEESKPAIGNGEAEASDTRINGVKVELVELVTNVDGDRRLSDGTYKQEKVWASYEYKDDNIIEKEDDSRYASGDGHSKIILNGPGVFEVEKDSLSENQGEYSFKSIPAGDFFVRFTYGEHDDTVLMTDDASKTIAKEINQEMIEKQTVDDKTQYSKNTVSVNEITGRKGRNAKSYNGQDYKSTIYQVGLNQGGEYYDIKGYTNYDGQNYTLSNGELNNGTDEASMYYYDIKEGDSKENVSDAKDVWFYRNRANEYGKGVQLKDDTDKVLLNRRAETLASFYKLGSYAPSSAEISDSGKVEEGNTYDYTENGEKIYDYTNPYYVAQQNGMINELEKNTYIVSQTGVINTEFEYNRDTSEYQKDKLKYTIDNLNLGLTERPKSQLKINKEVTNYSLILYNGQELFNAQKSANNLAYSQHVPHEVKMIKGLIVHDWNESISEKTYNYINPRIGRPGNGNSELIQNYVDNEMLANSMVDVTYRITVENVGEIDYKDEKFYYTGKEDNPTENISKTEAVRIVDYIPNQIKFIKYQNKGDKDPVPSRNLNWNLSNVDELVPKKALDNSEGIESDNDNFESDNDNFVNRLYLPELKTYNTIVTTEIKKDDSETERKLAPKEKGSVELKVSTEANQGLGSNGLTYNNMSEIIATANTNGRRCEYSIPGNEEMADQTLGDNAAPGALSSIDRILVKEIDADSAQKILLMPPTGTESAIGNMKSKLFSNILSFIKH